MIWWTSDQHYFHVNISKYCNRPFASVEEMNAEIVKRHNSVVKPNDTVINVGDFALGKPKDVSIIRAQLVGKQIFLRGSHDKWLNHASDIWKGTVEGQVIVACHYAMRVWPQSHYGSWDVYGHSHGHLPPLGKQHDVGVDNNDFYPVSFEKLKEIMATRDDNPNLIKGDRHGRGNPQSETQGAPQSAG